MNALSTADFATFMTEVHGHPPFPWQQALLERILEDGAWPDVLDVPTGLGKTSVIDVHVFAAAILPQASRRRMFLVVDRRLIVDEAFEHAQCLERALQQATEGVSKRVATALLQEGDDVPLQVSRMRGGVTWSWLWLNRPDRFAVIVGTVDQIGSRLLFRGYGVGEYLRPIDAALVGADSLIVLDEAHLAEPFRATATAAATLGARERPPVIVTMSATTPPLVGTSVHRISERDEADSVAGARLRTRRRLHLQCPVASKSTARTVVPHTMAGWAQALAGHERSGQIVGVICNTVARARAVFEQIPADFDRVLLTGRNRPIDRDHLVHHWYERIRADPRRTAERRRTAGRRLIVVATQTIEVGANIDLDALVSESAALPALIQRLGRLDRLAQLDTSHAVIVHDPATTDDDPVYGTARNATWAWLAELTEPLAPKTEPDPSKLGSGLAVSPIALRHLLQALPAEQAVSFQPPTPYVPHLFKETLDAWIQTSPPPHADPPVASYLHGIGRGEPDVAIVWRSGLPTDCDQWSEALAAVPPAPDEALEIPLSAARRWLNGLADTPVSDTEGPPNDDTPAAGGPPTLVRHLGQNQPPEPINADAIRPGDLLVVRSELGGCDRHGWNPASTIPVPDLADLAARRDRPIVRLRPDLATLAQERQPELLPAVRKLIAIAATQAGEIPDPRPYKQTLGSLIGLADSPLALGRNLRLLSEGLNTTTYPDANGTPVTVLTRRGGGLRGDEGALESSANSRNPMGLDQHQQAVAVRAAQFAHNLRLPRPLADTATQAAAWHDEGKRDPRFQAMLYQRPQRAHDPASPLLAKSGMDPADQAAMQRARQISGYPSGMRHEAMSARIAAVYGADDLLIHLVATHHGRARPLLPAITDGDPQQVSLGEVALSTDQTVDWSGPARFADLNDAYGPWHLALLETIVRLADIWCSEREEKGTP